MDTRTILGIYFENDITITENKFVFGWSVYNSAYEYFKAMQDGVFAMADEQGITILPHNQNGDTIEMINGCSHLVSQGINALIISPVNPSALGTIVEFTKAAEIPIIVIDIGTGGADVNAFIISDNYGGGILAGVYALRLIQEHSLTSRNSAILKVEETAIYARLRGDAYKSVLTENDFHIVAEVTANSDTQQAYYFMQWILASYLDDLAIVFCENDRMALGAAQAIYEAGRKGQILVIGFDGIPSAIMAIQDGFMQGTIAQQPYEMGKLGVEVANTILTGGTIIFDDTEAKELFVAVYLIDETGYSWK